MLMNANSPDELDKKETARLIIDLFHRTIVHHALWFAEVKHQMGMDRALEFLHAATQKSYDVQMRHLSKVLGFSMDDGIPEALLAMDDKALIELRDRAAKNWLAGDGIWFQTIEFAEGLNEAKRCNDSCWAQFSPFEASSIKKLLDLPESPGLEGLKKALAFRVYGFVNEQSFTDETADSFVFQMNDCRVQSARKRKGLQDYPCKSGGMVEYSYFARAVDKRITTQCIGCPPDPHPDQWFCAWKFTLVE